MDAEYGIKLLAEELAGFRTLTEAVACNNLHSYTARRLNCLDSSVLAMLLSRIAKKLDGADWIDDDPAFLQECVEAHVDYSELLSVPLPSAEGQEKDFLRKEIGDLGELIAVLYLLTHGSFDPTLGMPKNTYKLYQRVSEPGIDILAFRLDLSDPDRETLGPGEEAHLVECKASGYESFSGLAGEAEKSAGAVDSHRWQRELRMVRESFHNRGAPGLANRVKRFQLQLHRRDGAVRAMACLSSRAEIREPLALEPLERINALRQLEAVLFSEQMASLSAHTYAHRRSG